MKWLKGFLYFLVPVVVFTLSSYFTISIVLKKEENVVCPDVRGKTVEEAKRLAEGKGLGFTILRYERRNDVPYNHITVQKPEARIPVKKGRVVNVIVSEGPELVEVPELVGYSVVWIDEVLKKKQIGIEKTIYVPHARVGYVIAQLPKAGEKILQGRGITLFVGKEQRHLFLLPEISDSNITEISQEMDQKKIKYKVSTSRSERITMGNSIMTSIPARTIFSSDEEILINVQTGGIL